jgi:hypothetical protein
VQEEPNDPQCMITDCLNAGGDNSQEPATLLRALDQMLERRAVAIENELLEIAQVRKRIESLLPPTALAPRASASPGTAGASLGQMI